MLKRILSITMILVIVMASASFGFAEGKGKVNKEESNDYNVESLEVEDVDTDVEEEAIEEEEVEEEESEGKGKGKGLNKEWKAAKEALELEKDDLELAKDELEVALEALEAEYEAAVETGNTELAAKLQEDLLVKKAEFDEAKALFRSKLSEMKAVIKGEYTPEELLEIEIVTAQLEEEYVDIKVLPVENVLSKKGKFKFDVPPVIKEGRTLIPVRAITEGFGATVEYNEIEVVDGENTTVEKVVTITKDDITIILKLDDRTATVNGEEVQLDVASELMNNRTVVPLRFIAESLGLKVDWDEETETIELDEEVASEDVADTEETQETEETTEQ